jgi:hypothetical protein
VDGQVNKKALIKKEEKRMVNNFVIIAVFFKIYFSDPKIARRKRK